MEKSVCPLNLKLYYTSSSPVFVRESRVRKNTQARVKIATREEQGNTTRGETKSCYFAHPTIPKESEGIFLVFFEG